MKGLAVTLLLAGSLPLTAQVPANGMAGQVWRPPLTLLLVAPAAIASDPARGWDAVERLQPGTTVEVLARDQAKTAKLISVSPDSIVLSAWRDGKWEAKRGDVRDVWLVGKKSRAKGALWGAIAGAVPGLILGAAVAGQIIDENDISVGTRLGAGAAFALFTGGAGAAVGVAVGVRDRTHVYHATQRSQSRVPMAVPLAFGGR